MLNGQNLSAQLHNITPPTIHPSDAYQLTPSVQRTATAPEGMESRAVSLDVQPKLWMTVDW